MKTQHKIFMGLTLFSLLLFNSCSNDDNSFTPSASDISTTIDENPSNGTAIGTVTTNITGTIAYSITSQSVANAFTIDASTGAVTINDSSAFDFETNTTLDAVVSVTNSTDTATSMISVTLNDIDDIASFLTTSEAAYIAATNGEWVTVTAEEYESLAASLNEVTKSASTDDNYDANITISNTSTAYTWANNGGANIPNSSYIFAFKYTVINASNINGTQVKQSSTSISEGYVDLGGSLPEHSEGINYFVLKGSNSPTTDIGYLAIYSAGGISWNADGGPYNYGIGNVNSLPDVVNSTVLFLYQGLSSTQKQWD